MKSTPLTAPQTAPAPRSVADKSAPDGSPPEAYALKSGRTPELIEMGIERKSVLAYGWELDGSRIEWKIDNT
jgi:hypothetical protein